MVYKQELLRYGIIQNYYSVEELCWCMNGNSIKDYKKKENRPEKKIDYDMVEDMLNNAGAIN
jgi:hypothetical protein